VDVVVVVIVVVIVVDVVIGVVLFYRMESNFAQGGWVRTTEVNKPGKPAATAETRQPHTTDEEESPRTFGWTVVVVA
jgi:hypothetical protein